MADVFGLVLPFFGLILLGFLVARIAGLPVEGLAWMNLFIVYVTLPALFFQLLSRTPVERLTEGSFIFGSVFSTYLVFALMFVPSVILSGGELAGSTVKSLAAAYGNIGYMGPGLAVIALGPEAAAPVALIFCFENMMHFAIAPTMMALARSDGEAVLPMIAGVLRRIVLHPFIVATALGVGAAWADYLPPVPVVRLLDMLGGAAAPCALFAMGVTLALRPLTRVPAELGAIVTLKLIVHPIVCYVVLGLIGDFPPVWTWSAVLLAALPTATNVFVIAQQYDVWVQRASTSILVTTVLSVLSLTALLYAIGFGLLPADLFPQR